MQIEDTLDVLSPAEPKPGAEPPQPPARQVEIRTTVVPGKWIRPIGSDVARGEKILHAGTRLTAAEIGLLASVGATRVAVTRRPRVAVLSTGDELVEPGVSLQSAPIGKVS